MKYSVQIIVFQHLVFACIPESVLKLEPENSKLNEIGMDPKSNQAAMEAIVNILLLLTEQ